MIFVGNRLDSSNELRYLVLPGDKGLKEGMSCDGRIRLGE